MKRRILSLSLTCAAAAALALPTQVRAQEGALPQSATLARDVNGFRLGMTVEEARQITPLTYIGGDQLEAKAEGFEYNFGVTPRGRIYRVQSTQQLNSFSVDAQFVATLRQRLVAKYGEPTSESSDNFYWALTESVTDNIGQTLPFTTMWMNAYVGGFGGDPTLEVTIVDFRILWADQAAVNRAPREAAEGQIQF